jgi:hypothetical protein
MNWLWPQKQTLSDIETTIAIRLGRVLHWAAVAFAGVLWLGAFAGIAFGYWSSGQFVVGAVVLGGVVIFLLGRGLRYIFANE